MSLENNYSMTQHTYTLVPTKMYHNIYLKLALFIYLSAPDY